MIDDEEDPRVRYQREYREAYAAGVEAAPGLRGVEADDLREDLGAIERRVQRGRPLEALEIAALRLNMSPPELAGLLPAMTGAALLGYCRALVDHAVPFIASEEQERERRQQEAEWQRERNGQPRKLYGRR